MKPIFEARPNGMRRRTCMLIVTRACNLQCTYCYEHHKDNEVMTLAMAKDIILREAAFVKDNPDFNEMEIDFMGGEPLMNFELIREVVEWLDANPLPIPFICFATTNGTLLDEARKDWFRKHRKLMWLGVSYDGTAETQRKNRGTKENGVDFDFFHEVWPSQTFKMTISKESLPDLADGIIESQKKGYHIAASLAQGIEWNEDDALLYLSQLKRLSEAYLGNPDLVPINLLTRNVWGTTDSSRPQRKFCGTGVHMRTYDVDGRSYGCHMFSPVVLGVGNELEASKVDWACGTIADDPRCEECFLKYYCPTCMGFNYRYRGDLSKRDFNQCNMILAEALASCEFQIKVLAVRRESLTTEEAEHGQCALNALDLLSGISLKGATAPFIAKNIAAAKRR